VGGVGGGLTLRVDTKGETTLRRRGGEAIDLASSRRLAGDKDSGGARGRWSPFAVLRGRARSDRCVRLSGDCD
jgi:hypothetical protein